MSFAGHATSDLSSNIDPDSFSFEPRVHPVNVESPARRGTESSILRDIFEFAVEQVAVRCARIVDSVNVFPRCFSHYFMGGIVTS